MTFQGGWCSESPLSLSIIIRHYPSICPSFYLAPPRPHGTSGPCAKVQSRPWPELTEIQALRAMVGLQFRYLIWPLIKRGGQNYHWSNSICSPKFLGWIKVLLISVLFFMFVLHYLVGGFNPSEKYESQLGLNMSSSVGMMKFPIYGKIKNVPNHQPVIDNSHHSYIWRNIFHWFHVHHSGVDPARSPATPNFGAVMQTLGAELRTAARLAIKEIT